MKKYSAILIITLFTSAISHAQNKGYIGFSLGPAFAIGNFGSADPTNENAGLAKTGATVEFSGGYNITPRFGFCATIVGQANPLNTDAIKKDFDQRYDVQSAVKDGFWSSAGALAGVFSSIPLNDAFSFEVRTQVGALHSASPELYIIYIDFIRSVQIQQKSVTATALAITAGAGFTYRAGTRLCFMANVDYLRTRPEYKDVQSSNNISGLTVTTRSFSPTIETLNLRLGIGFRL